MNIQTHTKCTLSIIKSPFSKDKPGVITQLKNIGWLKTELELQSHLKEKILIPLMALDLGHIGCFLGCHLLEGPSTSHKNMHRVQFKTNTNCYKILNQKEHLILLSLFHLPGHKLFCTMHHFVCVISIDLGTNWLCNTCTPFLLHIDLPIAPCYDYIV